ncbi:MAG: Obg family GTPase CgtA, partial [Gemmatimonadaceae bacterium]
LIRLRPEATDVVVAREGDAWRVHSDRVEKLLERFDIGNDDALAFVQRRMSAWGVEDALVRAGAHAGDEHLTLAEEALSHLGPVVLVHERYMDAVTAVSGSGPAYFALLAEAMIEAKERYGDRVLLITFERLLKELEPTMERIASFLGIDFDPTLLEPTFNGLPIKANSSFRT